MYATRQNPFYFIFLMIGKSYSPLVDSSIMKMTNNILTIFPTELAKRQTEQRRVLDSGILDTSRFITFKKLISLCERAARREGILEGRPLSPATLRLHLERTAEQVPFCDPQPLARLSINARVDLLERAIDRLAIFAPEEETIFQWLLAHAPDHKLHGIGQLLLAWKTQSAQINPCDRFAINGALLRFLNEGDLPQELCGELHFKAVRWLNPFEERFIATLSKRLGSSRVQLYSTLSGAHAEAAEDRLHAAVRSELMRGNDEEWIPWLEDFVDAFEADDRNILDETSKERVSFFIAAHPYGEIEDVARCIAREIETGTAPSEIALILRDLSPYTDIIPHVFQRFGIPYHFRRGIPAAACPAVKALLTLIPFSKTLSRDRLCDLLLMPGVTWPTLDLDARQALVQKTLKNAPPRLFRLPKELSGFSSLGKSVTPQQFATHIQTLTEQHQLDLPDEVLHLIEEFHALDFTKSSSEQLASLFEKLLDNITLRDPQSTENGVWIINPMDAAGLQFNSTYLAGMDDRTFPQIPTPDSLLNSPERNALRSFLTERKIPCPRLTISETNAALIQEEILFLTSIGTAQEHVTLSYTRTDTDGKERAAGEFFERMRSLTETDHPELGESFHTILPPELCRAEDEVRQTEAFQRRTGIVPDHSTKEPSDGRQAKGLSAIQTWLENNPEFSATALESLARNRFVFFLEKILRINPDRTHEDHTDPMDRGTLVHDILERIYTAIAEQSDWYATPSSSQSPQQEENATGTSRLRWTRTQTKTDASIPLAVFDLSKAEKFLALARDITNHEFGKAEQQSSQHLGHPAVWETEKRKIHQLIENFIRMDLETALSKNRYPALFEMKFDAEHDLPVTLLNRTPSEPPIRLKGKIDRIDLIFDSDDELKQLLVVDYKGKSHTDTAETIAKKTALNLNCQLALYTFAAQERFFGEHNTPELNERVQAVYHLQECDLKKMTRHFGSDKKRLTLTPELIDAFVGTLFSNVQKLRAGDLATEPLIAGYDDYSHICRTQAIDSKELLKS